MSQSEVLRFAGDLKTNPALLAEANKAEGSLATLVELAARHGYAFTVAEAKEHATARARAAGKTLDEAALDKAVGGSAAIKGCAVGFCDLLR